MSDVAARAERARRLKDNTDFKEFMEDTRANLRRVFMNPHSSVEQREDAHGIVRALAKLEGTLDAAEADETIRQKKG